MKSDHEALKTIKNLKSPGPGSTPIDKVFV